MERKRATNEDIKKFVMDTALKCVANLKESDKVYMMDNPMYGIEYHFGYAMYIRNEYLRRDKLRKALPGRYIEPDACSHSIVNCIFSILLPDEYIWPDRFIDSLYDNERFINLRKDYKRKFEYYPTEIVSKYRQLFLKSGIHSEDMSFEEYHSRIDAFIAVLIEELKKTLESSTAKNTSINDRCVFRWKNEEKIF